MDRIEYLGLGWSKAHGPFGYGPCDILQWVAFRIHKNHKNRKREMWSKKWAIPHKNQLIKEWGGLDFFFNNNFLLIAKQILIKKYF